MGCLFSSMFFSEKNKDKWPTPVFSNTQKNYNTFDAQYSNNTIYDKLHNYNLDGTK